MSPRILILMIIAVISGCGQTGKLYLPVGDKETLNNSGTSAAQTETTPATIQATTNVPDKDDLEAELESQSVPTSN